MSIKNTFSDVYNPKNESIQTNELTFDLVELADILISAFAALHSEKAEADHE